MLEWIVNQNLFDLFLHQCIMKRYYWILLDYHLLFPSRNFRYFSVKFTTHTFPQQLAFFELLSDHKILAFFFNFTLQLNRWFLLGQVDHSVSLWLRTLSRINIEFCAELPGLANRIIELLCEICPSFFVGNSPYQRFHIFTKLAVCIDLS